MASCIRRGAQVCSLHTLPAHMPSTCEQKPPTPCVGNCHPLFFIRRSLVPSRLSRHTWDAGGLTSPGVSASLQQADEIQRCDTADQTSSSDAASWPMLKPSILFCTADLTWAGQRRPRCPQSSHQLQTLSLMRPLKGSQLQVERQQWQNGEVES